MKKTIAVATHGCKTNQYETEAVLHQFLKNGYTLVDFDAAPDVFIINTCCVTNRAEHTSRATIRRALKMKKEESKIIVTGCYVERDPSFLMELKDQILLFTNDQKSSIFDVVMQKKKLTDIPIHSPHEFVELSTDQFTLHSRVPLKVQDGCDFFCAYCILPYVRGNPRSRDPHAILSQLDRLTSHGVKEIILTGINLGLYGREFNDYNLGSLIDDIRAKTDIQQIRISSLEPMFFNDQTIENLARNPRICPHFHIALQTGDNAVLKQMNRTYTTEEFRLIINKIITAIPDIAIGCDVIVGLPGETDAAFENTYRFIEKLPITYLHVFRYSPRPGTPAATMPNRPNGIISRARMKKLTTLSNQKKDAYTDYLLKNQIPLHAILETCDNGFWTSVSDHFIHVHVPEKAGTNGSFLKLRAISRHPSGDGLIAVPWEENDQC